jgi:hypothetical protein
MERYSIEVRTVMDLVAMVAFQRGLPRGSEILVHSPFAWCYEDMQNRLGNDYVLTERPGRAALAMHLFDCEEAPGHAYGGVAHEIVAFRNRTSHKAVLYRGERSLAFGAVVRAVTRAYPDTESWGVTTLPEVGFLLWAEQLGRMGRFAQAIRITDEAHVRLVRQDRWRYLAAFGVVRGSGQ